MAQEFKSGKGWGEIAKEYDLNLGKVVSGLKRANKEAEENRAEQARANGPAQKQALVPTELVALVNTATQAKAQALVPMEPLTRVNKAIQWGMAVVKPVLGESAKGRLLSKFFMQGPLFGAAFPFLFALRSWG